MSDTLDDMLARLAAEEADEDTDSGGAPDPAPRESSVMKQLRAEIKRRDKAAKAAEERATKAEEELTKRVEEDNKRILGGAGLSPRQQEVFLRAYGGDVSSESVAEFKKDVLGVAPPAPAGEEEPEEFRPTGAAGAAAGGDGLLSRKEFEDLFRKDPVKANELAAAGKVKFRTE